VVHIPDEWTSDGAPPPPIARSISTDFSVKDHQHSLFFIPSSNYHSVKGSITVAGSMFRPHLFISAQYAFWIKLCRRKRQAAKSLVQKKLWGRETPNDCRLL